MATCPIKLADYPARKRTLGKNDTSERTKFAIKAEGIALQDLSDIIVQTMECELQEQEGVGNNPTHLIINNKPGTQARVERLAKDHSPGKTKGELVFRARAFFGTAEDLIEAAKVAYRKLQDVTRKRSGKAKLSYRIYLGTVGSSSPGVFIGNYYRALLSLEARNDVDISSQISIVGPYVIYGRVLYWSPLGGKTVIKRFANTPASRKATGIRITGGFRGTETMHRDVKKQMQRSPRWKAISFGDPFFVLPDSPMVGDRRVPALTIQAKRKGRVA